MFRSGGLCNGEHTSQHHSPGEGESQQANTTIQSAACPQPHSQMHNALEGGEGGERKGGKLYSNQQSVEHVKYIVRIVAELPHTVDRPALYYAK